jgi:hypothetical protein
MFALTKISSIAGSKKASTVVTVAGHICLGVLLTVVGWEIAPIVASTLLHASIQDPTTAVSGAVVAEHTTFAHAAMLGNIEGMNGAPMWLSVSQGFFEGACFLLIAYVMPIAAGGVVAFCGIKSVLAAASAVVPAAI